MICREVVRKVADALGVHTFASRSYIELVQLLQLTQEFSTITDKARAHFAVGEDVIIDDHVIGTSPARKLVKRNSSQMRHSADAALCTSAPEPARQIFGFIDGGHAPLPVLSDSPHSTYESSSENVMAAPTAPPGSAQPPGSPAAMAAPLPPRRVPMVPKSLLSRDVDALSLHGSREVPDVPQPSRLPQCRSHAQLTTAAAEMPGAAPAPQRLGTPQARSGTPRTQRHNGDAMPGNAAPGDARPPSRMARVMAATGSQQLPQTSCAHCQSDSTPWFWERRSDKPVDLAAIVMDLRADVKKAANELRDVGQKVTQGVVLAGTATALVAGCALGVAICAAAMRR